MYTHYHQKAMLKKSYLTPKDVAELLMVSTAAVRLWSEKGYLKARVTAGGHRRFKLDDIKQFAQQKQIQLNIDENVIPKILVVDDETMFAEFLKDLLLSEFSNVEVEISLDGFDAANKLRDFSPTIVLLDLKMPNLNGFQVCQHIKQDPTLQYIRILAMSGKVTAEDKTRILALGAEACFEKPLNSVEFFKQLNIYPSHLKRRVSAR